MKKNNKDVSARKAKRWAKNIKRIKKKENSQHYMIKYLKQRAVLSTQLNPEAAPTIENIAEQALSQGKNE